MTADLPGERWRPIAGFEDIYEVSDLGRVRSLPRRVEISHPSGAYTRDVSGCVRKTQNRGGYPGLMLMVGTPRRDVATLVAEAFLGPRPPGHLVAHLDGQRKNVELTNLAYRTQTEIEEAKMRRGARPVGQSLPWTTLCEADVREIRANPGGLTQRQLAEKFGVTAKRISAIVCRSAWKHLSDEPPGPGCRPVSASRPVLDAPTARTADVSEPYGRPIETPAATAGGARGPNSRRPSCLASR